MQDPESYTDWQQAAIAAAAWLLIDDARLFGFITGGPSVNRERCHEVLERAEQDLQITITVEDAQDAAVRMLAEVNHAG